MERRPHRCRKKGHIGGSLIGRQSDHHRRRSSSLRCSLVFGVDRRARRGRPHSCPSRRGCDAERQEAGPSSTRRDDLLLGFERRFRHDVHPRVLPLERGLSSFHFGVFGNHCRNDRPSGETTALAILAARSHGRNGFILYSGADRFLCRQWPELAAMARTAADRFLDYSDAFRRAHFDQCTGSSSAGEPEKFKLNPSSHDIVMAADLR